MAHPSQRQNHGDAFSSTDPKELAHFKPFAGTWWDERGPYRILHQLNPLRLRFAKDYIQRQGLPPASATAFKPLQGLRLLDVGCGGGLTAEPLARMGACVTGLDAVPEAITVAKQHAVEQGLDIAYHGCPLEELPVPEPLFDVVTAFEIVEHVQHPGDFLALCGAYLQPGGVLLLSTLNRTFLSYILGIVAAERILGWVPPGTHRWEKFITPYELSWLLERQGFHEFMLSGISFKPLTQTWKLSNRLEMNYLLGAVKK
ncbi:MAG: bifunctional 2-polyprenyl-6-hydroxyphenol methylase/3-demethylubiquinol 3-O-methyltransferase UbiG [Alphaproteobacteria bacterium]